MRRGGRFLALPDGFSAGGRSRPGALYPGRVPRFPTTIAAAVLAVALATGWSGVSVAQSRSPGTQGLDLPVQVAVDDRLVVRAQEDMDELAASVAALAPDALERIYADLEGLPRPASIEIRLVRRTDDMQAASIPGVRVPDWAAGVAFPRAGVVVVATHRRGASIDVESTTVHELAHMALGAALDGRAPRWLDEGFAYLHSADISVARAQTLTGMAWSGERYRFFEIESSFPAREDQAHRAYAQSYDFTAFLATRGKHSADYDDGDRFPFREMLAYVAAGDDVHVAAKRAFGAGFGELETEWWEQLRSRYIYAPAGLVGLFVWFIGAVLLVLGWLRRKRQGRRKMQEWAEQDAERDRLARVIALYERDSDDRPRYLN